jgi:Fasciclin domain
MSMSRYPRLLKTVALTVTLTCDPWTAQAGDIVETAEYVGGFNGLLRVLEAAGMVGMLKREGPFTVFAPTDAAFAQLPQGAVSWLLAEENRERLKRVVEAHIVRDAAIPADSIFDRAVEVDSLGGDTLALDGTFAVIALVPMDVFVTEDEGQTVVEEKSVATPVPTITVKLAQPGAPEEQVTIPTGQPPPMDVAMVVKPDIGGGQRGHSRH